MNYYQFHIGDYLTRTSHLSLVEHGAYRRLIDVYYSTEKALPGDIKSIHRLVMARTKEERDAVDAVLNEFFELSDGAWRQHRCDHEIVLCNKNRTNGKKGGRPSKNNNPNETQTEPKENPNETQTEPNTKAPITHYPLPITQEESKPAPDKPARFDPLAIELPDGISPQKWAEWIGYRRSRKLTTAEQTIRKQLEFLIQQQAIGQPAGAVIDASITNGWQGLFELKGGGNGKNGSSRADRVSETIAELTGANRDPSRVIDGSAARVD